METLLTLKQFIALSMGHLLPVELAVGISAQLNPQWSLIIQYINFAYFFAVGLHAFHWLSKKYGEDIWEIVMFYRANKTKIERLMACIKKPGE